RGRRRRPPSSAPPWRACSSSAPRPGCPSSARASRGASCARAPTASRVSFADPQKLLDARGVVIGEERRAAQLALVFGRLLLEDVAGERMSAAHLAAGGDLEPLLRARVCLHLRHIEPLIMTRRTRRRPRTADRRRPRPPAAAARPWPRG